MSLISPRAATAPEIAEAAEIYISRSELDRQYAAVQGRREREAKSRRWRDRARTGAIVGLTAAVGVLGVSVALLASGQRVDVVYVTVRDDGTVTNSMAWSSLPASTRSNAALNTLWRYVELREGYHPSEAQYAWNVVSALSAPDVRREYQEWAAPENPKGPRKLYGERDVVEIEFVSVAPVCTTEPCNLQTTDVMMFRFDRRERVAGTWSAPERRYATVRFRRLSDEGLEKLPWWQAATFNSGGIQVWEYVGSRREGVSTPSQAMGGGR